MAKSKAKILVIDDEEPIRRSLQKILAFEGYDVTLATHGSQGLNMALQDEPDLVLLDIKMPKMDGLEVLETMIAQGTEAPVVMISGHGTVQTAVEATKLGAFDFLEKPLDRERLLLLVRNALERKSLVDENRELKQVLSTRFEMVGQHPSLQHLKDRIDRVAPTNATVLVTGESGTGKELIARRVHEASGRKGRFVQVNCAAIPQELIESELFGHVKGAFTGAVDNQQGKFMLADRGTIFLDEIGDMSLQTQAKVLRVLQEGEVEPVGAGKTIAVDVRVIAATNKDLVQLMSEGAFREDLYYRLNVVPLTSITLSQRREDIPLLIQHFARRFASDNNLPAPEFSDQAIRDLSQRSYRGNIRELKNLVERMIIMGEDYVLGDQSANLSGPELSNLGQYQTLKEFKEDTERRFLIAKLTQFEGNISKTAEAIQTPRSNLYKKLEAYDIRVDRDIS